MGVTKLRLYGQFPIDTIVQIGNAQIRRAGALLPPTRYDDHIANTEAPAIDHHRHCEPQKRRGNPLPLRRNAPPGPAWAGEMRIATAYGLAMTEVDGGWSFFLL